MNILAKGGVIVKSNFYRNSSLFRRDVNGFINKTFTCSIQILNKLFQTFFREKFLVFVFIFAIAFNLEPFVGYI